MFTSSENPNPKEPRRKNKGDITKESAFTSLPIRSHLNPENKNVRVHEYYMYN
jgi:hypothetical protein